LGSFVISNDLLRKAVRAEYTLLRTPLVVLDEQIVSRYTPRGSALQTSLARTIGALDFLADRLLSEQSGAPWSEAAPARMDEAGDGVETGVASPVEPLPEHEQEEVEELAVDILEAEQEQTFAGELAADEELRRVQAELRAKHTVEERDESS
jgi:hypothetical protein